MYLKLEVKGEGLKNLFILGSVLLTKGKLVFYAFFFPEYNNVPCINCALRREGNGKTMEAEANLVIQPFAFIWHLFSPNNKDCLKNSVEKGQLALHIAVIFCISVIPRESLPCCAFSFLQKFLSPIHTNSPD